MGSTYLHVRISGFLDFQELQKVDKTVPSLVPTAVMDVQIQIVMKTLVFLSLPVDQDAATIWLFGKANAPARFCVCPVLYCPSSMFLCEL